MPTKPISKKRHLTLTTLITMASMGLNACQPQNTLSEAKLGQSEIQEAEQAAEPTAHLSAERTTAAQGEWPFDPTDDAWKADPRPDEEDESANMTVAERIAEHLNWNQPAENLEPMEREFWDWWLTTFFVDPKNAPHPVFSRVGDSRIMEEVRYETVTLPQASFESSDAPYRRYPIHGDEQGRTWLYVPSAGSDLEPVDWDTCTYNSSWLDFEPSDPAAAKGQPLEVDLNPLCSETYGTDEVDLLLYQMGPDRQLFLEVMFNGPACAPANLYSLDRRSNSWQIKGNTCWG